jgi:hypothetical protein
MTRELINQDSHVGYSHTLNNNTRGITAGVNSTFMYNATKTLDNCIVPTTTMTR